MSRQWENIARGKAALEEAMKWPGFSEKIGRKKIISKNGNKALNLVLNGRHSGPNALLRAYAEVLNTEEVMKVAER